MTSEDGGSSRGRMGRYTLEVIAPFLIANFRNENADLLVSALEAVATMYGGVESSRVSKLRNRRQYVNILDCESSVEKQVEWLRKKFPATRFILRETAASPVRQELKA